MRRANISDFSIWISDQAGNVGSGNDSDKKTRIIIVTAIAAGILLMLSVIGIIFVWKRKSQHVQKSIIDHRGN